MPATSPTTSTGLSIATVNVNGLRAALANGMGAWVESRRLDVITMQEVRAPDAMVEDLVTRIAGPGWTVAHDECAAKGRAGVAVISRRPMTSRRCGLEPAVGVTDHFDASGRWVEAELDTADGRGLTVVSCYVHTGDAESPTRMSEKLAFLAAARQRLEALRAAGRHVLLTGDLNVAHREADLKNWKGNLGKAGFLPQERVWFDQMFDELGWVDVGRALGGPGPGPYTWWSWRGKAFDTDAGWRIDYHIATADLASRAESCQVDRAPSYDRRWSDHAPVVAAYRV